MTATAEATTAVIPPAPAPAAPPSAPIAFLCPRCGGWLGTVVNGRLYQFRLDRPAPRKGVSLMSWSRADVCAIHYSGSRATVRCRCGGEQAWHGAAR